MKNLNPLNTFGCAKCVLKIRANFFIFLLSICFVSSYAQTSGRQLLRLCITNSTSIDYTVVYFEENRTLEFDNQYDAYKLQNSKLNLYTTTPSGTNLSINGMPNHIDHRLIPLNVLAKTAGKQTIAVKTNDNDELYVKYTIIDSLTHTHISAIAGNSIVFDIDNTQTGKLISNRFFIDVTPTEPLQLPFTNVVTNIDTENKLANTTIFPNPTNGESLKINLKEEANISITDCNGKELINKTMANSIYDSETIDGFQDLEKGVYLVSISTVNGTKAYYKVLKN